ncbi:MAG: DUF1080 domain-containing protein [Gemmataceae bacterium]
MRANYLVLCGIALLAVSQVSHAQDKRRVTYTDPAKAGPDYKIQGEYVAVKEPKTAKVAVQIVALGGGQFDLYVLGGGLPGDGWDTKTRTKISGKTDSKGTVVFRDKKNVAEIVNGKLVFDSGDETIAMKKIQRKSKTEGAKPPKGAIVLFDGTTTEAWAGGKIVADNLLHSGTRSKKSYLVKKIHLEFRTPFRPYGRGQGRGNSGTYINGREIQILDSFGLDGKRNECGAIYGRAAPRINMCYPPLTWQTFDAEYKVGNKGLLTATIWHNGVMVHENVNLRRGHTPQPINLQAHGNPVYYKNIWILTMEK